MNLRPSGYEPDELPGCSTPRQFVICFAYCVDRGFTNYVIVSYLVLHRQRDTLMFLTRFGGDLLSHTLRCSTIGAVALNYRVRNGAGCFAYAMTTKPRKKHQDHLHQNAGGIQVMYTVVYAFDPKAKPGFYWIKSSLSNN